MEASSLQFALQAGASELDIELIEILRKQSEELAAGTESLVKNSSSKWREYCDDMEEDKRIQLAQAYGKARQEVEEALVDLNRRMPGLGAPTVRFDAACQAFLSPNPEVSANTKPFWPSLIKCFRKGTI